MRKIAASNRFVFAAEEETEEEEVEESSDEEEASSDSDVLRHHLTKLLALLRAQYMSYQTSHWVSAGDSGYAHHLLFQRLYESIAEQIDTLAEKMVGNIDAESVALDEQMDLMKDFCDSWCSEENLFERGLKSEEEMQAAFKEAYDELQKAGELSLGMDDYLMATASEHDTNIYLLQQAVDKE